MNKFNGTIDDVRIPRARSTSGASNTQCYSAYNYARTAEQIKMDYNKGLVRMIMVVNEVKAGRKICRKMGKDLGKNWKMFRQAKCERS